MNAYYQTHSIGILYLLGVMTWYSIELIEYLRQREWRRGTTKAGPRAYWPAFWACMAGAVAVLFLAPHIVPAAAIGDPVAGFVVGMVLLVAGVALRVWSFQALGRYFTFTVRTSPDQPVISSGPYRLLRHPGYAGGLLATIGIGVMWGNWLSLGVLAALSTLFIVWRIRTEERTLLASMAGRYGAYAAQHKRLVPLVW
ncbi:MAG TPA: isoprenylcysteine carboxylmethyltransferase family protein [Streptosporangiaceae bacterium]|jgi:protein-S-isoprenylcysteine O-methyltransferase